MEIRSVPLQERENNVKANKEKSYNNDPFYSHEMVKLADEAKEHYDAVQKHKVQVLEPATPPDETVIEYPN